MEEKNPQLHIIGMGVPCEGDALGSLQEPLLSNVKDSSFGHGTPSMEGDGDVVLCDSVYYRRICFQLVLLGMTVGLLSCGVGWYLMILFPSIVANNILLYR